MPQTKAPKVWIRWSIYLGLVYGGVLVMAVALKWLAARSEAWADLGGAMVYSSSRVRGEAIALVIIILLAWVAPRFGRRRFATWEKSFARIAAHRRQAIFVAAVLPLLVRLALLPALPVPQPYQPDEFGHLLLADTFASGRITNPTHPMWPYFETLYVFHQPTYTSLYPIAQGLVMAVPLALGVSPWWGVCASMGLMCAALAWMLQGWLPPKWALLGALIAGFQLAIATYWMNSYWGGGVSALGGALLLGALPRLLRQPRVRDAFLAGLGVAILSQSRPFEGALLTLPVAGLLLYRLARHPARNLRVLAALTTSAAAIAAGTLYYNRRVTGDPWLWPYQLHQKIYGTPQNLRGTAPVLTASRAAVQKDIQQNFEWQLDLFQAQSMWKGFLASLPEKAGIFWDFFLQPIYSLPLLFLPLSLRRRGVCFALCAAVFVLAAGFAMYPFFFPHYAAPLYGLVLVLLLEGARRMPAALFPWWILAAAASCLSLIAGSALAPDVAVEATTPRSQIEQTLKSRGGKHLVVVEYTESHNYHHPWIYNAADIDRSAVVWAREMAPPRMALLLDYYRDRSVWLVRVGDDENVPELEPYRRGEPAARRW
jgi:hypothetical protein